jgi:hypothetical protein
MNIQADDFWKSWVRRVLDVVICLWRESGSMRPDVLDLFGLFIDPLACLK